MPQTKSTLTALLPRLIIWSNRANLRYFLSSLSHGPSVWSHIPLDQPRGSAPNPWSAGQCPAQRLLSTAQNCPQNWWPANFMWRLSQSELWSLQKLTEMGASCSPLSTAHLGKARMRRLSDNNQRNHVVGQAGWPKFKPQAYQQRAEVGWGTGKGNYYKEAWVMFLKSRILIMSFHSQQGLKTVCTTWVLIEIPELLILTLICWEGRFQIETSSGRLSGLENHTAITQSGTLSRICAAVASGLCRVTPVSMPTIISESSNS